MLYDNYVTQEATCKNKKCKSEIDRIRCSKCGTYNLDFIRGFNLFFFIIAGLSAIILFRASNLVWPMYFVIAMGIIHLYALVISRKPTVLRSASLISAIISLVWFFWLIQLWVFTNNIGPAELISFLKEVNKTQEIPLIIPVVLWVVSSIWAFTLGRRYVTDGNKIPSSYFLGTGAFILGLWPVLSMSLNQENTKELVYQIAIAFSFLAPIIFLIALLQNRKREQDVPRSQFYAFLAAIFSAYIFSTEGLTNLVNLIFGHVLPRIFNKPAISNLGLPPILEALRYRIPLAAMLLVIAILIILVSSAWGAFKKVFGQHDEPASKSTAQTIEQAPNKEITKFIFIDTAANITTYIIETLDLLLKNTVKMILQSGLYIIKMIRFLLLPVIAFTIISISLIFVLQSYAFYTQEVGTNTPWVLWCEALMIITEIILLCGVCFGIGTTMGTSVTLAISEDAFLIGAISYFLISIASVVLIIVWFGFSTVKVNLKFVQPGPIYGINLFATTIPPLILGMFIKLLNSEKSQSKVRKWISSLLLGLFLFMFLALAVVFGLPPILDHITSTWF